MKNGGKNKSVAFIILVSVYTSICGQGYFATDLIAYAFVRVFLSDAKFMGGEYLNKSCNLIAANLCSSW